MLPGRVLLRVSSEQSEPEGHDVERQDAQHDENAKQKNKGHDVTSLLHVQVFENELRPREMTVHIFAIQSFSVIAKNCHHRSLQAVFKKRNIEHPAHVDRSILFHEKESAKLQEWTDEEGPQNGAQFQAKSCSHCQADALRNQSCYEHDEEE